MTHHSSTHIATNDLNNCFLYGQTQLTKCDLTLFEQFLI